MAPDRYPIPPAFPVIALEMAVAEFAPLRILFPFNAGLEPWQDAQLAA
jgi:hypothetical protein